jgi:hypothetical protein
MTVLNSVWIPVAKDCMVAAQPKATRAMTKAYSTKFWPSALAVKHCHPKKSPKTEGRISLPPHEISGV